MSEFPISCIRCRRRKIKCNKRKPCNQCLRKGMPCDFPSKFRNKSIDDERQSDPNGSSNSDSADQPDIHVPSDIEQLQRQVRLLQEENEYVHEQNVQLQDLTARLSGKLNQDEVDTNPAKSFHISGETTERGQKYYGPFSSNNMAENLKSISEDGPQKTCSSEVLNHHSWTGDPDLGSADSKNSNSDDKIAVSMKKPLPWLAGDGETEDENASILKILVRNFFSSKTYDYFISEAKVVDFIDSHPMIEDENWESDDDLTLLLIILILSLERITPEKFNKFSHKAIHSYNSLWKETSRICHVLYHRFSKIRHNLINESYATVQAYILCTEWHFLKERYEESWSMLFHSCAIAYSLGLHVVLSSSDQSDSRSSMSSSDGGKSKESVEKSAENKDEDYYSDILPRLRVWFALRNLSSQMCSIFGRPNPIMLQVNSVSLPPTSVAQVDEAKNRLTNSQLKSGLSECIRLSNSNVIEKFMRKIAIDEAMSINSRFDEEIESLSYYLSRQYEESIHDIVKEVDGITDMPTFITRKDVLIDLIVLHVNRIKLLDPFLQSSADDSNIIGTVMDSIVSFFEHANELVSEFVRRKIPQIMSISHDENAEVRLDKLFMVREPFLSSFIYQGVVVTYIMINCKASELMEEGNLGFLNYIETKLKSMLALNASIEYSVKGDIRIWSTNNLCLMRKILENISLVKGAYKSYRANGAHFGGFEFDPQIASMLGNTLKDPFWIANPENTPNYLGLTNNSTSYAIQDNGTRVITDSPETIKLRASDYSSYDDQMEGEDIKMQPAQSSNYPMLPNTVVPPSNEIDVQIPGTFVPMNTRALYQNETSQDVSNTQSHYQADYEESHD